MVKNYFSLVASELFSRIISFFWVVYMARYLGVEDYGRYATVMAVISIATSFLDLGVHFVIVREMVHHPENTAKYLGAQIYLRIIMGAASMIFFAMNVKWSAFSPEMKFLVLLAGLHMIFHNVGMIGDTVFSAFNKQYLTAIMHTAHNLGWAVLGFVTLKILHGGLDRLLLAMVINSSVICIIYLWVVFTRFSKPDFNLTLPFVGSLVEAGLPIGLTGLFAIGFQRIDRILISSYSGSYEVGLYSAAMTLVQPIADLIWSSAIIVLYPYMASLIMRPREFKLAFQNILVWLFAGLMGCSIFFLVFPAKIIQFSFGAKYAQSTVILGVLALQLLPIPFQGFLGRVLMVEKKQRAYGVANFLAFVFNLCLNLILIKRWGIFGAAISSVLTNIVLIWFYSSVGKISILPYLDYNKLLKAVAACGFAICLTYVFQSQKIVVTAIFFWILYIPALLWILNLKEEWPRTLLSMGVT